MVLECDPAVERCRGFGRFGATGFRNRSQWEGMTGPYPGNPIRNRGSTNLPIPGEQPRGVMDAVGSPADVGVPSDNFVSHR